MLLIIGLDGATWDLLDPWIAQGRLPHLARLRRSSAWGPLASTTPPATLPSWSTFMTGVNPGKHGIFDFTRRRMGTYEVQFVNATFRKVPTIWSRLSAAGRRVCVLGLPGTYPPEQLNGCMVSGFDTPVTTRADASFVSPADLAPLVMQLGGFPFADFQEFRVDRLWYRRALDRLLRGIETKLRLATTLLQRELWDCFMVLFGESDTVAHHFWHFHDPASPRFDAAGATALGDALRQVYESLDAAVGALMAAVPAATVLIASDHGFGGSGNALLYLNRWLERDGFLRSRTSGRRSPLATAVKHLALRTLPASAQARAFRVGGGRWAGWLESRSRFAGIDWSGTRAFSEELNYFPNVWLNVRGREPQGVVDSCDYERVRNDVCAAALELRDPEHGRPIVRRAWRREELYVGPWTQYAPDVVLDLHLDRGYSYTCLPSATAQGPEPVRRLQPDERVDGKLAGMSGSHRPDGVFMLRDRAGHARRLDGVQIADMAATILVHCQVDLPADCDGRGIDAASRATLPALSAVPPLAPPERVYGAAEEAEIAARLRDLGYLQ